MINSAPPRTLFQVSTEASPTVPTQEPTTTGNALPTAQPSATSQTSSRVLANSTTGSIVPSTGHQSGSQHGGPVLTEGKQSSSIAKSLTTIVPSTATGSSGSVQITSTCGVACHIASVLGGLSQSVTIEQSPGSTAGSDSSNGQTSSDSSGPVFPVVSYTTSSVGSTGSFTPDGTATIVVVTSSIATNVAATSPKSTDISLISLPGNSYLASNQSGIATLSARGSITWQSETMTVESNGVVLHSGTWMSTITAVPQPEASTSNNVDTPFNSVFQGYIESSVSNRFYLLEGCTTTLTISESRTALTLGSDVASVGASGLTTGLETSSANTPDGSVPSSSPSVSGVSASTTTESVPAPVVTTVDTSITSAIWPWHMTWFFAAIIAAAKSLVD
jgi:hypothetical protein